MCDSPTKKIGCVFVCVCVCVCVCVWCVVVCGVLFPPQPLEYELRLVLWNTRDVRFADEKDRVRFCVCVCVCVCVCGVLWCVVCFFRRSRLSMNCGWCCGILAMCALPMRK